VLVLVESNTTGTGRLFAEQARRLGLAPHMLSSDATRYPYVAELGIPSHECSTTSVSAVLACCAGLAREHAIIGVTSSSEYFIATAAHVARALGLPGEDPGKLAAARSKLVQRQRFAACGVGSPGFRPASSAAEAVLAAGRLGLPVVVKPISRSGSIGVRRCDTSREVAEHAAELLATTQDERGHPLPASVLVESYLPGPEFSVEILDGSVRAVVAKRLDQSIGFLEVGHDLPAAVSPRTGALLASTALAATAALGLSWGAAHVEVRVAGGRAYVVEVNPRLAGGMIPQAILAATGQDLIAELVALAAGKPTTARPARPGCASIRFLVPPRDGTVRTVPDTSAALALPGVVAAGVSARPGQQVGRQGSFLDRLGYVIATGKTRQQAGRRADRAMAALAVEIVPASTVAADAGRDQP
jgi:argininosuccinate lyase